MPSHIQKRGQVDPAPERFAEVSLAGEAVGAAGATELVHRRAMLPPAVQHAKHGANSSVRAPAQQRLAEKSQIRAVAALRPY